MRDELDQLSDEGSCGIRSGPCTGLEEIDMNGSP